MLKVAIESYPYEQAYLSEIYEALKQTYPCFQVSVAVRGGEGGRAHESPPLFFRRVCPTLVLSSIVCSCCARCFRACQSINPALLSPQQTADSASWKNSVRHNLSIHSQFQRIAMVDSIRVRNSGTTGRRTKGSAGLWTVLNTAVSFRHHRRWWCCLRPSLYLLLEAMVLASQWNQLACCPHGYVTHSPPTDCSPSCSVVRCPEPSLANVGARSATDATAAVCDDAATTAHWDTDVPLPRPHDGAPQSDVTRVR
jgi:hypothetical protein